MKDKQNFGTVSDGGGKYVSLEGVQVIFLGLQRMMVWKSKTNVKILLLFILLGIFGFFPGTEERAAALTRSEQNTVRVFQRVSSGVVKRFARPVG